MQYPWSVWYHLSVIQLPVALVSDDWVTSSISMFQCLPFSSASGPPRAPGTAVCSPRALWAQRETCTEWRDLCLTSTPLLSSDTIYHLIAGARDRASPLTRLSTHRHMSFFPWSFLSKNKNIKESACKLLLLLFHRILFCNNNTFKNSEHFNIYFLANGWIRGGGCGNHRWRNVICIGHGPNIW